MPTYLVPTHEESKHSHGFLLRRGDSPKLFFMVWDHGRRKWRIPAKIIPYNPNVLDCVGAIVPTILLADMWRIVACIGPVASTEELKEFVQK